jgi:hypothetical protein
MVHDPVSGPVRIISAQSLNRKTVSYSTRLSVSPVVRRSTLENKKDKDTPVSARIVPAHLIYDLCEYVFPPVNALVPVAR